MNNHGDLIDCGIEALAHELSQVNMFNFSTIDDDGSEDGLEEEDFDDSIAAADEIEKENEHLVNDSVLAERTSEIISSYRNYLTETTTVTTENQRLANEMSSLRGSLGMDYKQAVVVPVVPRDPPQVILTPSRTIEIEEELRSRRRYSLPVPTAERQCKKRLGGVAMCVAIMGCIVAGLFFSTPSSHEGHNGLRSWDPELAAELQQQEEADVAAAARTKEQAQEGRQWKASEPPHRHKAKNAVENPAMKLIQGIISHPADIEVTSSSTQSKVETGDVTNEFKSTINSVTNNSIEKGDATRPGKKSSSSDMQHSATSKSGKASSSKSEKKAKSKSKYTPLPSFSVSHGSKSSKTAKGSKSKLFNNADVAKATTNTSSALQMQTRSYTPAAPAPEENPEKEARLHLEAASILYQAITIKYDPIFFDRTQGWAGTTFTDAAVFCASTYPEDAGYGVPCPREVYCPEGPNSLPFGGYRTDVTGGGMFAPIIDETEHWLGWVQISDGHSCMAYNYLNPEPAGDQVGHIMCCRDISR